MFAHEPPQAVATPPPPRSSLEPVEGLVDRPLVAVKVDAYTNGLFIGRKCQRRQAVYREVAHFLSVVPGGLHAPDPIHLEGDHQKIAVERAAPRISIDEPG